MNKTTCLSIELKKKCQWKIDEILRKPFYDTAALAVIMERNKINNAIHKMYVCREVEE